MILTFISSFHVLYLVLSYLLLAWLPVQTTPQTYENMVITEENDNFPSNHKTKEHTNSPNKLVMGVYRLRSEIYVTNQETW